MIRATKRMPLPARHQGGARLGLGFKRERFALGRMRGDQEARDGERVERWSSERRVWMAMNRV